MLLKIIRKILNIRQRMLCCYNYWSFSFNVYVYGRRIELHKSCVLNVPVSTSYSSGKIKIESETKFGSLASPIIGNGKILLQARNTDAEISIGSGCIFSNNISIISTVKVIIGDELLCGDGVTIIDSDFHVIAPEKRRSGAAKSLPVTIGNNVWLGSRVMILKGVNIGDHSIIASGSIVTGDIPERVIAGGIPARVLKGI